MSCKRTENLKFFLFQPNSTYTIIEPPTLTWTNRNKFSFIYPIDATYISPYLKLSVEKKVICGEDECPILNYRDIFKQVFRTHTVKLQV